MKTIACLAPLALVLGACRSNRIDEIDPSDGTPPTILMEVQYRPAGGGDLRTVTLEGDSISFGAGTTVTVEPGSTVGVDGYAEDPNGVKLFQFLNVGADFTDMNAGEITSAPPDAYGFLPLIAHVRPEPGRPFAVQGNARNFGALLVGSTDAYTPFVRVEVPGTPPPLPTGHQTSTIFLGFRGGEWVSDGVTPTPPASATVVGITTTDPFGGDFWSIHHGLGDFDTIDRRTESVRVFPGTTTEYFAGPWVDEPWRVIKGIRKRPSRGASPVNITLQVHWLP